MESPHVQTDPDYPRSSFHQTVYEEALPAITTRFPNIDPLYITKIFRGTITPLGLIWLDVDRDFASPFDSPDISHLLYCFEVYGQIICIFTAYGAELAQVELLQRALADYRIRLLKLAKTCTFESLRAWHGAFLNEQFRAGQDKPEGWRAKRENLMSLLRRQ